MEALAIGSALRRHAGYRKRGSMRKTQRKGVHEDCKLDRTIKSRLRLGKKRKEEVAQKGKGREGKRRCQCDDGGIGEKASVKGEGAQEALARQTEAIFGGRRGEA